MRLSWAKVKHARTAAYVVAGYRVHKSGDDTIGSLLLGLHKDEEGATRGLRSRCNVRTSGCVIDVVDNETRGWRRMAHHMSRLLQPGDWPAPQVPYSYAE